METAAAWRFVDIEQDLHETAIAAVGFEDFGDPSYLAGLRALLHAYDEDDRLTDGGRLAARYDLQGTLIRRLRSEKLLRERAGESRCRVRRPIFITGLVRTGSTALHYLMGQDPELQPLPHWLAENPMPVPPRGTWESHPNFQRTAKRLHSLFAEDPSRAAMHFMGADLPEECGHLLAQNFTDDRYIVSTTLPSYARWYENTEHSQTYVRHRRLIELIGASEPDRRWLLKYPVHLRQLPALLAVYPDACIVQTHRDPLAVLRSYTNMVASYRKTFEDPIDRAAIAREQMESWAAAAERGLAARAAAGGAARFVDLSFDDFTRDPLGSVRRICRVFDHELSDDGAAALAAWQDRNSAGAHGRHEYGDREFPVRREEVVERFAAYIDHFGIEVAG
jgi:hypothetical protein